MGFLWGWTPQKLEKALPKSFIHLINKTRQNMQKLFSKYLYIPLYFATLLTFFYPRLGVMQLCKVAEVCRICRHGRQNWGWGWEILTNQMPK